MRLEPAKWSFPSHGDFPPAEAADWELHYIVLERVTLTVLLENSPPSARELAALRASIPQFTHEPPQQLKAIIGNTQELVVGTFVPAEAQRLMHKAGRRGLSVRASDTSHRGYLPIQALTGTALIIEDDDEAKRITEQMREAGARVVISDNHPDDVGKVVEMMNTPVDWNTVWRMQSQVAGLYQLQLTDSEMDWAWPQEVFFGERYWDVFCCDLPHLSLEEEDLLMRGCLFMIACLCLGMIDGSNFLLREERDTCETAIRNSVRLDKVEFLREYTLELLEKARQADIALQNLVAEQTEVELGIRREHRAVQRLEADPKALHQFKAETVYHYFAWCHQRALELQLPSPT